MKLTNNNLITKRSKSYMRTSKEILYLIGVIGMLLYIEKVNIVYCGTIPSLETIRTGLQDFVADLTDEELRVFAHRLRLLPYQEGTFQPEVDEIVKNNYTRWKLVPIFVIATVVLYVVITK